MRLFSEELSIGSYEVLITLPVSVSDIILGKFLAGSAFVAAMLLPTLSYPLFIAFVGNLDWGTVIGGYLGALFLGSAYTAVGLFASSLTRNQIVAFIIGVLICFSLTLVDKMLFFFPESIVKVVGYIGADYHFQNISKGILDSRDILYFASVIFICLYGSALSMIEKE
jgi:ABC-2 type transport system permease protein